MYGKVQKGKLTAVTLTIMLYSAMECNKVHLGSSTVLKGAVCKNKPPPAVIS